jgi:hypothetical protein
MAPAEVRFDCPSCKGEGKAVASTRSAFWLDSDVTDTYYAMRTYFARCASCGPVTRRHPIVYLNVVCVQCAGRLTWATRYDTAADITKHPLVCARCATLADAGLQFGTDDQALLAAKLHRLDDKIAALQARTGLMPTRSRALHRLLPDPAIALPEKREQLRQKLIGLTQAAPAQPVAASELPRPTMFG